jgi:hypothetical protein
MAEIGKRAWQLYRLVISLIALGCVVQFYLAGRGVFGIHGDASLADQSSFDAHRMVGNVIAGAAIVAVVLVIVLWDTRLILWTVILAALAVAVQRETTKSGQPWIAGLHAVSGLAILGISASLAHRAWRHRGVAEAVA